MSGGAQQAGTTTTTQAPPSYLYPYIGTALGQAGNLLQMGGPNYYPGQQVASFNPAQEQAFSGIQDLAGSSPLKYAQRFNNSLLRGNFTGPESQLQQMGMGGATNPYLDAMFKQAAGATQGQLASEFAGAGRNVDASAPVRGQQLNDLATNLYGGAYAQDQANALAANQYLGNMQQNAVGNSEGILQSKLGLQGALAGVGNQVQGQSQALIDASKNAYNYQEQRPYANLQQFESFLGGLQPGSQTSSPYFNNPLGNALGTTLAGLGIYNGAKTAMGSAGAKGASSGALGAGTGAAVGGAI